MKKILIAFMILMSISLDACLSETNEEVMKKPGEMRSLYEQLFFIIR